MSWNTTWMRWVLKNVVYAAFKNHSCIVFIHNQKNCNGLNLFAITVHFNCNPVLTTWAKHCLQSGTCLLWEMVGCDMALLVEISYLSHCMSCSSHSVTLLQMAFLFWFISLKKKKKETDLSASAPTPSLLKDCRYAEETAARCVRSPQGQKRTDIWTSDQFRLSSTTLLVLEDWFDLILRTEVVFTQTQQLNTSIYQSNLPTVSVIQSDIGDITIKTLKDFGCQADWWRWSFFEYLRQR